MIGQKICVDLNGYVEMDFNAIKKAERSIIANPKFARMSKEYNAKVGPYVTHLKNVTKIYLECCDKYELKSVQFHKLARKSGNEKKYLEIVSKWQDNIHADFTFIDRAVLYLKENLEKLAANFEKWEKVQHSIAHAEQYKISECPDIEDFIKEMNTINIKYRRSRTQEYKTVHSFSEQ